ncbi:MAG: hypothetical protein FD133_1008 [Erysipelotrichaceae bacterium]|nr:MAG: hypothetical protein FD179_104 [Erysipelotrichaceae bacterium]TXT18288.1 MAG: hypothetical protein FD133_1008 [Erysipelotrichaceae bacterium]
MKQALYIKDNTAIINFSTFFAQTTDEFISSDSFKKMMSHYVTLLKTENRERYDWLTKGQSESEALNQLVKVLKLLLVLDVEEVQHPLLSDRNRFNAMIEDWYNSWRQLQRCSVIKISSSHSGQVNNFIEADTKFNALILAVYRGIQEKIQGHKNRVYRQLQAGTNASMVLKDVRWPIFEGYEALKGIPFVDSMLIRAPLLLHPRSSKRVGSFEPVLVNPFNGLTLDREEWFCYPAKVGSLLILIYVHIDFTFSGITNANLFELASDEEVLKSKPDGIVLFGLKDKSDECTYTYDEKNKMWVGKVPYQTRIEYFGYMKKMVLTIHNVIMMKNGWLPIHGSMINVNFKGGRKVGVVFMGDSGAGKSETIEAIQMCGHEDLVSMDVIFDDMGSFHVEDGQLVAQGTEIGAFIRLDDLDKGSPYKTMDRSIFMNPESTVNARVVIPVNTYKEIVKNHKVDYFLYANNYVEKTGLLIAEHAADLKQVFIEGKRMAIATTHETGLSTTYFANPFGPMQNQALCDPLIEHYFKVLDETHVKTGEVYTGLGLKEKVDNHLELTAQAVLNLIHD